MPTMLANKSCSVVVVIKIGLLLLAKEGIRSTLLGLEGENSSNNSCCRSFTKVSFIS